MGKQPKKINQYDYMGNILMHSDFKKSVVKVMLKRRKHVYCWKSRWEKQTKQQQKLK